MKKSFFSIKRIIISVLIFSLITPFLFTTFVYEDSKPVKKKSKRNILIKSKNVNISMDIEDFIPLVILKQIPYDSPEQLIITQSIIVRTWITKEMNGKESIDADKIGLPYYTRNELKRIWFEKYKLENADNIKGAVANITGIGANDLYDKRMGKIKSIIGSASGKVLAVNGTVIYPLYNDNSNGKTRDGESELNQDFSYLKEVECRDDQSLKKTYSFTVETFVKRLKENNIIIFKDNKEIDLVKMSPNEIIKMSTIRKNDSGYVETIKIADTVIEGYTFGNALGLKSADWSVIDDGNKFVFSVKGSGHGFGLSINQARIWAKNGLKGEEILKKFYEAEIIKAY